MFPYQITPRFRYQSITIVVPAGGVGWIPLHLNRCTQFLKHNSAAGTHSSGTVGREQSSDRILSKTKSACSGVQPIDINTTRSRGTCKGSSLHRTLESLRCRQVPIGGSASHRPSKSPHVTSRKNNECFIEPS